MFNGIITTSHFLIAFYHYAAFACNLHAMAPDTHSSEVNVQPVESPHHSTDFFYFILLLLGQIELPNVYSMDFISSVATIKYKMEVMVVKKIKCKTFLLMCTIREEKCRNVWGKKNRSSFIRLYSQKMYSYVGTCQKRNQDYYYYFKLVFTLLVLVFTVQFLEKR